MCVENVTNEDVTINMILCAFDKFSNHISDKIDLYVETVSTSLRLPNNDIANVNSM